jgi:hypothetical protein
MVCAAFDSKFIYASHQLEWYFQPESFSQGELVVKINPSSKSSRVRRFKIPTDLPTQFSRFYCVWPLRA